ncbi:endonuclease/exonuclease/phosphatase family protein [Streptomyces fulvorobeus]|uniref:Endonuclease n=1 Tax=Streptomyces fulvorobeus TaxID=284028 RepID=A0A7J0CCA3_9ACTN|nr:endonuclease/exonuclease/phosphatase family protein [Streptomyces fulvorobeus]NYE43662.1 hypothetical protein [Streptomyces fulvorobeus]GFN00142.1 endonuclease [Streptomyces fulvorobeus]
MHISRHGSALLAGAVAVTLSVTALPAAFAAPSPTAVVSEVYGGGGNSGATLTRDFIELANAGSVPYGLAGFSVQYLPATPSAGSLWQVSALTGSIAPGGRYLVAQAAGTGGTVALPTADATGTVAMSASGGTVALVSGTTPLTCRTAADCAADSRIVDLVGYGSAVVREGSPVTGASATASVARGTALADTDDNAADLSAGTPGPVNAAGETSGGTGPGPGGPGEPGTVRVHDIQGTTRLSPLAGQSVTGVPGVVTAVRTSGSRGFWIQDTAPDADARTGEGLFVHTGGSAPAVAVGDSVLVSGKVAEYYPAATAQSLTQLTAPKTTVLSSGNALPAPVVLDAASVPDAYAPTANGGSIEALPLDPAAYALDLYESLEGTRVRIADTRITGATTQYDEIWVTVKPEERPTVRGGTLYASYTDQNTGRIKVLSLDAARPVPVADVGDVLSGTTTGVMDYASFGGYNLQATELGTLTDNHLRREVTRPQRGNELAVATYNVENLDALDDQGKFDTLAAGVAVNLSSPDVLSLEEIQDDNGPVADGSVGSDATLKRFTDAIVAAGGPRYAWRYVAPEDGQDGGEPGGNIRNVFLFNPERVDFVDRAGGDATTPVTVVDTKKGATLSVSPGRITPTSSAWEDSRKPLVGEFRFHGKPVFVIANHFTSKGGDQPLHGRNQEPVRGSETKRVRQAAEVNTFVKSLLAADRSARVVTLGDLNDFAFSPTMDALTSGRVLKPLITTLPEGEQYSYVFDGNSQTLDHILTSPAVTRFDYDVVHINAEFADQASDHDPQIVRMQVNKG